MANNSGPDGSPDPANLNDKLIKPSDTIGSSLRPEPPRTAEELRMIEAAMMEELGISRKDTLVSFHDFHALYQSCALTARHELRSQLK